MDKSPDVYTLEETVIVIDGNSVVRDSDQQELAPLNVTVNLDLKNRTDGSDVFYTGLLLQWDGTAFYTIAMSEISGLLEENHVYYGHVSDPLGVMRTFGIVFGITTEDIEQVYNILANLPFRVNIANSEAWVEWLDKATSSIVLYKAAAYMGGKGATYATLPELITHRGPVIKI